MPTWGGGLTFRQPLPAQGARLGRRIDVHRTMPSVIPHRARRCHPTSKSALFVIAITSRVQSAALVLESSIVNVSFDGSSWRLSPAWRGFSLRREPGGRYFICSCSEGLAGPVVVD
jgi:uncharacterized membrane protein